MFPILLFLLAATVGPERLVTTTRVDAAVSTQREPRVAVSRGRALAVWTDWREEFPLVYASAIADSGALVEPLGRRISDPPLSYEPVSAVDAIGVSDGFVVFWRTSRELYARRLDHEGRPLDEPQVILRGSGFNRTFVAAASASRILVTTHVSDRPLVLLDHQLRTVATLTPSQFGASGSFGPLSVAPAADESLFVLSSAGTARVHPDGEVEVLSRERPFTGSSDAVDLAWTGRDYVVAWIPTPNSSRYEVRATRISADGRPSGASLLVGTSPVRTWYVEVASSGDGSALIAWNRSAGWDHRDVDAMLTTITADDQPIVRSLPGSSPIETDAALGWNGSGYVAVWSDGYGLHTGRIARSGEVVAAPSAGFGEMTRSYAADARLATARGTRSSWIAAFEQSGREWRVLLRNVVSGQSVLVAQTVTMPSGLAFASRGDQLLVLWVDDDAVAIRTETSPAPLYARRFDAAGRALDAEPIFIGTSSAQNEVAATWDGRQYLVAFSDGPGNMLLTRVTAEGIVLDDPPAVIRVSFPWLHGPFRNLDPALDSGPRGSMLVFRDQRSCLMPCGLEPNRLLAMAISTNGRPSLPAPVIVAHDPNSRETPNYYAPQVVWADERFVVSWETYFASARRTRIEATSLNPEGHRASATSTVLWDRNRAAGAPRLDTDNERVVIAWMESDPAAPLPALSEMHVAELSRELRIVDETSFAVSRYAGGPRFAFTHDGRTMLLYTRLANPWNVRRLFARTIGTREGPRRRPLHEPTVHSAVPGIQNTERRARDQSAKSLRRRDIAG